MRGIQLTRWLVATAAVALAGCNCNQVETCDNTFLTFDAPADGATVNAPLDVAVSVVDKGGNAVELSSATISTRLSSATEFSVPAPGALETGKATFGAVPMATGPNLIRVSVQKANSTCSPVSKTIAVTVQDSSAPPEVTAFTISEDANGDGYLNSAELAVGAAAVNANITISRAIGCTVAVKYVGNAVASRTVDTATVTVSLPATGLANLVDGTYRLLADVSCPDGRRNDPVTNTAATKDLIIDRMAPTCALLSPSKTLYGPNDDDDPATTGYQVRTLAQAGTGAVQMEIKLTGGATPQTTGPQSAAGGTLAKDFTIPNTGTTQYSVVLEVVDTAGNLCTVAKQVGADFNAPQFTITAPTSGAQTSYNLPVTIAVTSSDNGSTVVVTTTPSGGSAQAVCGGVVANGAFTCNGSFVAGAQTVTVTVTDAAGNSTTQTVSINVTAPGCAFAFTSPTVNPATLTPADDLQPTVTDLQYRFVAASPTSGCSNKTVKVFRNGVEVTGLAGTTNGGGVFTSAVVTEPDSGGSLISYRAEIDDGAGNKTSATMGIYVALLTPNIVTPANNTNLSTQFDLDPTTAGIQTQLVYSPTPPTGYTATICSSVQFGAAAACPDGKGGFVLGTNVTPNTASFTFPDGTYDVRAVFIHTAGTNPPISNDQLKVHLNVESVRPTVSAFTYQGNANGDAHLNSSEQASGDPVALLTVGGANGGTVVVRRTDTQAIVSGATPAAITGGAATVTLSGLGASSPSFEAPAFSLVAEITTAVGSRNVTSSPPPTGTTLNSAAFSTIRVDRVPPTCTLVEPSKAQLGIADDADAVAANYQVQVHATTVADVGANGVTLELTPSGSTAQTQQITPANLNAQTNFTPVQQTGELDYTAACQARDLSGNVGVKVTRAVKLDLLAPTCTFVTPNAGASPYTTSYVIATQVNVTGADGFKARIYSTPNGGSEQFLGETTVATGQANVSLVYLSGLQTVRAQVTDGAGNSCSGAGSTAVITVSAPGCSIQFNKPAAHPQFLNAADDTAPASPTTLEYTLTGSTNCPNQPISIFVAGNLVGTPTTSGSGAFSQNLTGIVEGPVTIRGDMNFGTATSNSWDVTVDLSVPVIVSTVPATNPSGSTLHFVAPGNRNLVPPADPTYVVDSDTNTAGAQASLSVRVTGAAGGSVTALVGTTTVGGPTPVSLADETVGVSVDLAHGTSPTLILRVIDAAGNTLDRNIAAQVDVIAPAVPGNISCTLVPGKEREAKVSLAWDPSYDDGAVSSSGPVQYDVRWTNTTVTPTGLANANEFFDSAKTYQDAAAVAWSATRITREVPVPTFNSYYCFVRAYDEQGNYSTLAASVVGDKVDNLWTKATFSNPAPGAAITQFFGRYMASKGSLNNDSIDDLVVGYGQVSGTTAERVFVYYGNANATTFANQTPQAITAPDGLTGNFGFDVSIGNVGDAVTGDNKPDLVVGAPLASSSAGRVYLFFGSTSAATIDASTANTVIFQGNAASELGRSAQVISDINGDGLSELLLVAGASDGNRGRAYLFLGRSRTAWLTLAGGGPILMTSADREFLGPTPVASTTLNFGRLRGGIGSVGTDILIPASASTINRLYLFSAATVMAGSPGAANAFLTGFEPTTTNSALQTLTSPSPSATFAEGFGSRAQSDFNAIGGPGVDLLVGEPSADKVHLFADRSVSNLFLGTPTTTIKRPAGSNTRFGMDARAANFSTLGGADLFVGEFGPGGALWYLQNRDTAGTEFDTDPGVAGFWHSKTAGVRIGSGLAVGDFNGDAKPDIAVADTADTLGKVFVWY